MSARGGRQRIPRPPTARAGSPPPWAHLPSERRRFTLAEVRARCAELAPPRPPSFTAVGSRPAAVLVPFFEVRGEAHVILTKRPEHMPSHQGEIAFPGGGMNPDVDRTPLDAALREAEEEIGLSRTAVEVVAELDSIATVGSRFTISPFVGLLGAVPDLRPAPGEVEKVLEVPISELLADGAFREELWDFGRGRASPMAEVPPSERPIHFFDLVDETVWGATARILTAFLTHLTDGR